MNDIEEAIRDAWDDMAYAYDRFRNEPGSYARMIEEPAVIGMIGLLDGKRVLDIGCGSGAYEVLFAKAGARIVALDISMSSIRIASEKVRAEGLYSDFILGSASRLEIFKDDSFDAVFSSTTMHYVADIRGTFKNVFRMLKDGGVFVLSAVHPYYTAQYPLVDYTGTDMNAVFGLRYFNTGLRQYVPPWSKYVKKDVRPLSYHYTTDDYFSALRDAGFAIDRLAEPRPLPEWKNTHPRRYYEMLNYPLFLIFKCKK